MGMRILIVGASGPGALEMVYLRCLNSLDGVSASIFSVGAGVKTRPMERLAARLTGNRYMFWLEAYRTEQQLLTYLRAAREGFDAVIVFKGMHFSPEALARYKEAQPRALWLNINPDDPFNLASVSSSNKSVLRSLSFFDTYFIWSRALVERLRQAGCKDVIYLPFGYDGRSGDERVPSDSSSPACISFVGAWDPLRERLLTALHDYDLRIYGPGWWRVARRSRLRSMIVSGGIFGDEFRTAIASATASLNILRPQNAGAHNMRTFEIPAMGGLMLTSRSEEQQVFFPDREASFMYSDVQELRDSIDVLTTDTRLAHRIRSRGQELLEGHSYQDRAKVVLSAILDRRP